MYTWLNHQPTVVPFNPFLRLSLFVSINISLFLIKTGDVYMVESPTYYRAFQPILKTLQQMNIEEMCFSEELVRTKPGPLPLFLEPGTCILKYNL